MKFALVTLALFACMARVLASPLTVMIHSEDPDLHPANACDGENTFLEEELLIAMGHRVEEALGGASNNGRNLQESAFCAEFCSYFPSRAWCWAYTPMCARESGHRALAANQKVVSDFSLECAKTVVAIEDTLKELADFANTDSCRSALLDKKEYECFRLEQE